MFKQVLNSFCSIHLLQTSPLKQLYKSTLAFLYNLLSLQSRDYIFSGNVRMLSTFDKESWKVKVRGKRNTF